MTRSPFRQAANPRPPAGEYLRGSTFRSALLFPVSHIIATRRNRDRAMKAQLALKVRRAGRKTDRIRLRERPPRRMDATPGGSRPDPTTCVSPDRPGVMPWTAACWIGPGPCLTRDSKTGGAAKRAVFHL